MPIPAQVPTAAVTVNPRWMVPLITGTAVLTGIASVTGKVAPLAWVMVPSGSVAVTSTRTVAFSSSVASV